ncbi:laminin subunit gamma-2 isoform 2-T2 [Pholidichthys leucotaenia]
MKISALVSLCGLLSAVWPTHGAHTSYFSQRCECNGRSHYCLRDSRGLHCLDCQGNTEGRHCERCKDGFYQQGAALSCVPCGCNPTGSVRKSCDSEGRCSCRGGITGDKCDRCPNGPIGPDGCLQSRQPREDSGSLSLPCFCFGHSSHCSPRSGYSVHNVTSNFITGPEGWMAAVDRGVTPPDIIFRWSPKYEDLEVISADSPPLYLYAPEPYLGNHLLSYGQNLSFLLRLDRGIRHPSINDVILEGGGLRVSASLGNLSSTVPCGYKIRYSFRLDERGGWTPQLSSSQFQTLLHNITAIKIRGASGDYGRGYLDNVQLVSARPGVGAPAPWVRACDCPPGYEGLWCERCSAGFRRRDPGARAFGACVAVTCDPLRGDCYSADETPAENLCLPGFYRDPRGARQCIRCPCPDGRSCSLAEGALEPQCDRCPSGTTGFQCDVCQNGYYGDPVGVRGERRPCRPCDCNGHIDVGVVGSCDRFSGECLKCLNNTVGRSCEDCVGGFYHRRTGDACKPCNCDVQHSESQQCDDSGQCRCRPGFEGLRCQRSNCPSCFTPVKQQVEDFADKLKVVESLFSNVDKGLLDIDQLKKVLRDAEDELEDMRDDMEDLEDLEKRLQGRLSSISRSQLSAEKDVKSVADAVNDIERQKKTYGMKVEEVKKLMEEMKQNLEEAKRKLRSAELPVGDAPLGSSSLSPLVEIAESLADKHTKNANAVEETANDALRDSKESLDLARNLMNRENKVKGLIGDLKTMYDQASAQVKVLEKDAKRHSGDAKNEIKMANGMLMDIADLERNLPPSLKNKADAILSSMDGLRTAVDGDIADYSALRDGVQTNMAAAQDLLSTGKNAQKEVNELLSRVHEAEGITQDALKRISGSSADLDNALNVLRGFDGQIASSKLAADAAIERLPSIDATIQRAAANNADTSSLLEAVGGDYDDALLTISQMDKLLNDLEGTFQSLPPHTDLLSRATKLNMEAKELKEKATDAARDLESEQDRAWKLQTEADKVAGDAAAVFNNAKRTRDAVGRTLKDINALLNNMNQSDVVDEDRVKQLEDSLASAQKEVEGSLRPRLRDLEHREDAQRRLLSQLDLDLATILGDIANLREINSTVPAGCFNSPPIEEA